MISLRSSLLLLALLPGPALGQRLLFQATDLVTERYGADVAILGDLTADGVPEIAVAGLPNAFVLSGADGSVLYTLDQPGANEFAWSVLALPDLDGDGVAEFAVGGRNAYGSPPVHAVYSGLTGTELWTRSVAALDMVAHEDVNGDGVPDYTVADEGRLWTFSGADGTALSQWTIPAGCRLNRLERLGDVNGDGIVDLVSGQIDWWNCGPGWVRVHSGVDLSVIWEVNGLKTGDSLGFGLAAGADLNADGEPDVVAMTVPWHNKDANYVWVLSGVDGSLIREESLPPEVQDTFCQVPPVAMLDDVDADGVRDYAIGGGPPDGGPGVVEVRSGASGAPLMRLSGPSGIMRLDGARDWDGDGLSDLAVSAQGATGCEVYGGHVFVWSLDCNGNGIADGVDVSSGTSPDCDGDGMPDECRIAGEPWLDWDGNGVLDECSSSNYCEGVLNSLGLPGIIGAVGTPVLAENDLTLTARQLPPGSYSMFLLSEKTGFKPGFHGGVGHLCIGRPLLGLNKPPLGLPLVADKAGEVSYRLDLTTLPKKWAPEVGTTWYLQLWYLDWSAKGSNTTDAIEVMLR